MKRLVGAAARIAGAGGLPEEPAFAISNSNNSGNTPDGIALNALSSSRKSESSRSSELNGSSAFPLPQTAANLAGDKQALSKHSSRRSRDLKHERQFGVPSGQPPSAGPSSGSQDTHLYGKPSRPRKMRANTAPGSGQSTSTKSKASGTSISTSRSSRTSQRRFGWKFYVLLLFALVIVGTFTVLRTVVHFFGVHEEDVISIEEVQSFTNIEALPYNAELSPSQAREEEKQLGLQREKIPRIIHATWKNEVLPERWETVRKDCIAMLPDFEFRLWTDAGSREFIANEYPSFLPTWDSYRGPTADGYPLCFLLTSHPSYSLHHSTRRCYSILRAPQVWRNIHGSRYRLSSTPRPAPPLRKHPTYHQTSRRIQRLNVFRSQNSLHGSRHQFSRNLQSRMALHAISNSYVLDRAYVH